jgi:hypothetical protein
MKPVMATGVPNPEAFKEGVKRERDQEQLQPAIRAHAANRHLQGLERALLQGEPVQEEHVENDKADREEACHRAENCRTQGEVGGHRKGPDRNANGYEQCDDGGDRSLDPVGGDQHQGS